MSEQLSLAGFDSAPQPTDRLFFALFPDADTAAHIARFAQRVRGEHGLKGRPLAAARLHITLHHLGDYIGLPHRIVAAAGEAAATVAMPPFDVAFDRAASFCRQPRSRPFVLHAGDGVAALTALHLALSTAMNNPGLGRPAASQYAPHLTLLYDDLCIVEHAIEKISWTAREFVLVHSLLGRTRHVQLARWPLHA